MNRFLVLFCVLSTTWVVHALPSYRREGYFLVLKVVQDPVWGDKSFNHASMFQVALDGSISKWWNVSFDEGVGHISNAGAFAFDDVSNTVYLPTGGQITAISQNGQVTVKTLESNKDHQNFWNYFYDFLSDSLVGVCSDKTQQHWSWCKMDIKSGTLSRTTATLPYTDGPNGLDQYEPLYSIDMRQQLIWYKPYSQYFLIAANYSTGKTVFVSGKTGASCIAHNPQTNKTYIVKGYDVSQYYRLSVFELLPKPQLPKEIVRLSNDSSLVIGDFGRCETFENLLYIFMTNFTTSAFIDNLMPTDLVTVNLSNKSYKQVPLDYKKWKSDEIISGFRYVPPSP